MPQISPADRAFLASGDRMTGGPPVDIPADLAWISELLVPSAAPELLAEACRIRDACHGPRVSYSRKVFIPLTRLCRDVCSYCTFATRPKAGHAAYLTPDEVLAIARAG